MTNRGKMGPLVKESSDSKEFEDHRKPKRSARRPKRRDGSFISVRKQKLTHSPKKDQRKGQQKYLMDGCARTARPSIGDDVDAKKKDHIPDCAAVGSGSS